MIYKKVKRKEFIMLKRVLQTKTKTKTKARTHRTRPRQYVAKLSKIGHIYKVCGFVHRIRDHGKIIFVEVRDITGIIQVVFEKSALSETEFKKARQLTKESVICVKGVLQKPAARLSRYLHTYELFGQKLVVHSKSQAPLPLEPFSSIKVKSKKRFDYRFLDLREPKKRLIFKIWTELEKAFTTFAIEHGFIQIHTPKIMPVASEGEDELFYLDYFGKKAYLAQSAQFYKQMAMGAGFEKVFQIGPVFRATKSFTTRHDTEFTQYDIEMSFVDYKDLMKFEEKMLVFIMKHLKTTYGQEIKKHYKTEVVVPKLPFPRIKLSQAKELLKQEKIQHRKPGDLSPEEEKVLAKIVKQKYGHEFVFVTHYPKEKRAFYHAPEPKKPKYAAGYDLLYKGLEITTGSTREHRYKYLIKYAKQKGVDIKSIAFYLEFFKYGMPPHGGFGFGPSRFIKQLLDLPHVKEATYLPRMVNRLMP